MLLAKWKHRIFSKWMLLVKKWKQLLYLCRNRFVLQSLEQLCALMLWRSYVYQLDLFFSISANRPDTITQLDHFFTIMTRFVEFHNFLYFCKHIALFYIHNLSHLITCQKRTKNEIISFFYHYLMNLWKIEKIPKYQEKFSSLPVLN